jgi:hypothetical protein
VRSSIKFFNDQNKVRDPLFFRATKGESSILLLGTCHKLPISVLPGCVLDSIESSHVLCCEKAGFSADEINDFLTHNPFDDSINNNWYGLITKDAKDIIDKFLIPHIAKKFSGLKAVSLKSEWVIDLLGLALRTNPETMDETIINKFDIKYSLDKAFDKEYWGKWKSPSNSSIDEQNAYQFSEKICLAYSEYMKTEDSQYITGTLDSHLHCSTIRYLFAPKTMCVERNEEWTRKLNILTQKHQRLFIAVGADHLVEETGLLTWLQDSDYDVEHAGSYGTFYPYHYKKLNCFIQ